MPISALRGELNDQMLAFAWNEWTQMGVLATPTDTDRWAADPEALLLFSLELGRNDPRLFDELLDGYSQTKDCLACNGFATSHKTTKTVR